MSELKNSNEFQHDIKLAITILNSEKTLLGVRVSELNRDGEECKEEISGSLFQCS